MKRVAWILVLSFALAAIWRVAGKEWALGAFVVLASLRLAYDRNNTVRTKVSALKERLQKQAKEPHPLTPVGLSLIGTLIIVNLSAIWDFATDTFDKPTAAETALQGKIDWLQDATDGSVYIRDSYDAFKAEYARFDFDRVHDRHDDLPVLGVDEAIERRYEFAGREVTIAGDIANVENYPNGVIGLWIWDADEHVKAEAGCAVKVDDPDAFLVGRRARIEGIALLTGTTESGTEYSRSTLGLACARADILPYRLWSAEEIVDEYIDGLQNADGWRNTLQDSRQYLIDHYDEFRFDRVHRYDGAGLRESPVRHLVWALQSFDGQPLLTWGWVVSTSETAETINGKRYVRQQVTIRDEDDSSSEATCDVLRPRERGLREGDWVNATGIPLGSETAPSSEGGFSNTVRMVCSTVRRV